MNKTIERIRKFRNDRDWSQFHTPENLAKAISIEAGELLEHFFNQLKYGQYKAVLSIFFYSKILNGISVYKMIQYR